MSFEAKTIETAMDELLNRSSYFSISDLDKIGEAIGVNPEKHPDYKFLRLLHCVHYKDMDNLILRELPQKVMNCLHPAGKVNVSIMTKALLIEGNDHINTEDSDYLRLN